jgi:RES domain-containing protein
MTGGRKARDPDLLELIDQYDRTPFAGPVWRVVRETRDPLQASPVGARWDPGTFDVLYTSLDRDGALEETYFHLSRQPAFPSVPFKLHRLRVRATKVLHLPEMGMLEKLGVDTSRFSEMDYTRTQAIGDAAHFLGFDGLIVPSARSRFLNLVLFDDRIDTADAEVEQSEPIDWKAWRRSR